MSAADPCRRPARSAANAVAIALALDLAWLVGLEVRDGEQTLGRVARASLGPLRGDGPGGAWLQVRPAGPDDDAPALQLAAERVAGVDLVAGRLWLRPADPARGPVNATRPRAPIRRRGSAAASDPASPAHRTA